MSWSRDGPDTSRALPLGLGGLNGYLALIFNLLFPRVVADSLRVKIACLVAGVLFSLFAYWQLNDLGQYGTALWQGWVLLYGFTALLSFWTFRRDAPRWIYAALAIGCVANALYRFTAIQWGGKILYNENNPAGNETGGLIIVALWAAFLWWKVPTMGRGALVAEKAPTSGKV